ncbi:MAG TPA: PAS domain S-box protein, partial [Sulfurospirillum arcachonense]|nr:PAS domain S-box protein [Sulfurospirillum arcachonense]
MKTYNTYYRDETHLIEFLNKNNIEDRKSILVQVFTGLNDKHTIEKIVLSIKNSLPSASIIGTTTDGEILNGGISTYKTAISITLFENTSLHTTLVHRIEDKIIGKKLASQIIRENTKVIITFADGLHTNGDNFIQSIDKICPDIVVAGGTAGDNATFENTYVFTQDGITNNGAVGVSLNSDSLHIHTDYSFNWQPVGKELTITKAKDNIVYTIDNKTAYDTYAYFLGEKIAKKLPSIGIEFPLIISGKKMPIARAVLAKNSDDSLTFAGNLKEGEKVRIGFGNVEMILKDSYKTLEKLNNKPVESIFIYSCMARRRFMPKSITVEIEPLQRVAPTAGFFAYGEFCTMENKELLNQTMTILALSESSKPITINSCDYLQKPHIEDTIEALSHIINTTTSELKATNDRLKTAIEGSRDGLWEWNLSTSQMYYSQRLKEMLGYKEDELDNSYRTWVTHMHPDDRRKLFEEAKKAIQNRTPFHCKHRIKHKDGRWIWVLNRGKAFYNEDGKVIMISGFQTDITKE